MPLETSIWKIGPTVERVQYTALALEQDLQKALEQNLEILSDDLMLIGRQVRTENNKFIDLLAMNSSGHLHVIELKKGLTPRDVVAQALDYAAWVRKLSLEDLQQIYAAQQLGHTLLEGFAAEFEIPFPETVNGAHQLTIVAAAMDAATERIVRYLLDYGVPINVVFFRHFMVGSEKLLVRSWLVDPEEAAQQAVQQADKKQPWNGQDFYVNFGEESARSWADAVKYGFLSAGRGKRYSRGLSRLQPGHRVAAYIPGAGYVGVGVVQLAAVPMRDFPFVVDGAPKTAEELTFSVPDARHDLDDPGQSEWLVGVDWQQTVPKTEALSGSKLFTNPTIVCRLTSQGTLDALAERFPGAFTEDAGGT